MAALRLNRESMEESEKTASLEDEEVRLREEFVTLARHELLTPLTSLMLQTQILRRTTAEHGAPSPERVTAALDLFDRQLSRLQILCDDLVQAACIRADQLSVARKHADLGALVRAATARVAAQYPTLRGTISVDADAVLSGMWDPAQIERAVLHLVRNAVLFGEGKPIEVLARATPGGAQIVVRDHGIGIALEDQKRIFERFERAVPVTHFGGIGLGLYITNAIVRAHGGTIQVESMAGQGTTFTVDLPLAQDQPEAVTPRTAALRRATAASARGATRTARLGSTVVETRRRVCSRAS